MNRLNEMTDAVQVGALLQETRAGNGAARDKLLATVYDDLRRLARRQMGRENAGHTLSATALVHEAFLKLSGQDKSVYDNREHFLAIASIAMRRVLVSHARKRHAAKRGSGERAVTLDEDVLGADIAVDDLIALDAALGRLSELSERQANVIVCRAFGAMTDAEIANALGISIPTVRRDQRLALAWLRRELSS